MYADKGGGGFVASGVEKSLSSPQLHFVAAVFKRMV